MSDDKTKKHQHSEEHKVYKSGDKYICEECGSEVTYKAEHCPSCELKIDWLEVEKNVRR